MRRRGRFGGFRRFGAPGPKGIAWRGFQFPDEFVDIEWEVPLVGVLLRCSKVAELGRHEIVPAICSSDALLEWFYPGGSGVPGSHLRTWARYQVDAASPSSMPTWRPSLEGLLINKPRI